MVVVPPIATKAVDGKNEDVHKIINGINVKDKAEFHQTLKSQFSSFFVSLSSRSYLYYVFSKCPFKFSIFLFCLVSV